MVSAVFDPYFSETEKTDAGKIAGGNTNGTRAERRVNLNLADDYYKILNEAEYLASQGEDGQHEEDAGHEENQVWHYFINDVYYQEDNASKIEPYSVIVNVRENTDGSFVYSFETYKPQNVSKALKRKRITTKPASAGAEKSVNVDNSSKGSVPNHEQTVKDGFVRVSPERMDSLIEEYAIPGNADCKKVCCLNNKHRQSDWPGIENVKAVGHKDYRGRNAVYVTDIGEDIVIGKKGLNHGLGFRNDDIYTATPHVANPLENSIRINYLEARGNSIGGYLLLSCGVDPDGNMVPVYFNVARTAAGNNEVVDFNTLYSLNAKKKQMPLLEAAVVTCHSHLFLTLV